MARRRFRKKRGRGKGLKKKVNYLMKVTKKEPKWLLSSTANNAGGNIGQLLSANAAVLVTAIGGSALADGRIGNRVYLKAMNWIASVNYSNAASLGAIRLVIFIDRQPVIGTPITWGGLMDFSGAGNDFVALPALDNRSRFRILKDIWIRPKNMTTGAVAGQGQQQLHFMKRWKGAGMRLNYTDTTLTNVIGPHIYYFIGSDISADLATLRQTVQLRFVDDD